MNDLPGCLCAMGWGPCGARASLGPTRRLSAQTVLEREGQGPSHSKKLRLRSRAGPPTALVLEEPWAGVLSCRACDEALRGFRAGKGMGGRTCCMGCTVGLASLLRRV